ncbi:Uncharacterised protein [Chlamydia trachomatis]|nr:Uncharacterised protein [Chlamydia trachomatis]
MVWGVWLGCGEVGREIEHFGALVSFARKGCFAPAIEGMNLVGHSAFVIIKVAYRKGIGGE